MPKSFLGKCTRREKASGLVHSRVSALDIATVSHCVPLLSNLLFVRYRGNREVWSTFRWLVGGPSDRAVSSLPAGRL